MPLGTHNTKMLLIWEHNFTVCYRGNERSMGFFWELLDHLMFPGEVPAEPVMAEG